MKETLDSLEKPRGNLWRKPVAPENLSGRPVVWSGGLLQARRANEDAPCILLPRHVAPNPRHVALLFLGQTCEFPTRFSLSRWWRGVGSSSDFWKWKIYTIITLWYYITITLQRSLTLSDLTLISNSVCFFKQWVCYLHMYTRPLILTPSSKLRPIIQAYLYYLCYCFLTTLVLFSDEMKPTLPLWR